MAIGELGLVPEVLFKSDFPSNRVIVCACATWSDAFYKAKALAKRLGKVLGEEVCLGFPLSVFLLKCWSPVSQCVPGKSTITIRQFGFFLSARQNFCSWPLFSLWEQHCNL